MLLFNCFGGSAILVSVIRDFGTQSHNVCQIESFLMGLKFSDSYERNPLNGKEVRQEEHDILPKMRPAHAHTQRKNMLKLRLWRLPEAEKVCVAEDQKEER